VSRVRLLERDEAPLSARHLYGDDGSASLLRRSLVNAPDILETLMPFLAQVSAAGSVDLVTKELVVVRVSHLNRCVYCLSAHRPLALDVGVPPDQVAAVCDETSVDELPERERVLVEWIDRFVLDPGSIDDELTARVLDYVRDDQLIEIALVAGTTQMLNHYCTAFAIPPEGR